ncbi:hypothetical protein KDA_48420 [Dictyobacter alpinus]|uniref:Lantibiotic dehydratase n=1 Tax=Dictyobacter alpinus TaxID=2014873 RepID=A0A402BD82_9CHLR|nr:lantibiotic dehydratase [Dictyobacter alpinus]GCE29358.1 hypothetical protein KDA_48420 [Dictyobacter alpinus]
MDDEKFAELLANVAQETNKVLGIVVQCPEVAQALMVASPSLFESLHYLQQPFSSRRQERVYASLLRYIVRMSTRATPFGLFSGIAIGMLADETTAEVAMPPVQQICSSVDISWLLEVVKSMEQNEDIRPHLHIIVNPSVYCVGSRAVIPFTDADKDGNIRMTTLQITPVVSSLLQERELTQTIGSPLSYHILLGRLLLAFPHMPEQHVDRILRVLLYKDFLLTDLRPCLLDKDPLLYVLKRLQTIPGAQSLSQVLGEVVASTLLVDQLKLEDPLVALHQLREAQEKVYRHTRPSYSIDTTINIKEPLLNKAIGDAASQAAEILLRIAPPSSSFHALRRYHEKFIETYGIDAEIPLLTLLSPEIGLGLPQVYTGEGQHHFTHTLTSAQGPQHDAMLTALFAEALNKGVQEIELNASMLDQLASCTPKVHTLPYSTVELYFQICARSREALDTGNWRLVVAHPPALLPGGRTFGRFHKMMDQQQLDALKQYIKAEEALFPEVIFAELNYIFPLERDMNVMLRPQLRSYEIVMNTWSSVTPENRISLDDLVVGVRPDRFYLRSLRLGKEVVVCQSHALNTERTPPLCRFLLDASSSGYAHLSGFDWGCLQSAPFLPRLRYQQIVLSPAQWRVRVFDLLPERLECDDTVWFLRIQRWRNQWSIPRFVYLVEDDNRFLLDLEHPGFLAELRRALSKSPANRGVLLQEMFPDAEQLWLQNTHTEPYVAEIILPLILRPPLAEYAATHFLGKHVERIEPHRAVRLEERRQLPGAEWTSLKLYTAAKRQNDVITGPLKDLVISLQEQQCMDYWFFIRYADPDPHVRVRFHATHSQHEHLLLAVLAWSRKLIHEGLIQSVRVEEYNREVERYGGPLAFPTIEHIFCASSNMASDLLTLQSGRHMAFDSIVAAVWSLDHFFAAWGVNTEKRLVFVQELVDRYEYADVFRLRRKLLLGLFLPEENQYFTEEVKKQKEMLLQMHASKSALLQKSAQVFHELALRKELWQSEHSLLRSLAHMHLNRLQGIDPEQEMKVYACWKYTLESSQKYLFIGDL